MRATPTTRVSRVIAIIAAVVVSVSCGSTSDQSVPVVARDIPVVKPDPGPPDFAPVASTDRLPSPERHGSARLDPPPFSPTVGVSLNYAKKVFETEQLFPASGKDAPHSVHLASYSDDVYKAQIQENGESVPAFRNQLVWAFIYRDVAPRPHHGPAVRSGDDTSRPAGTRCSFIVLLDALTGEYIMGGQNCGVSKGGPQG